LLNLQPRGCCPGAAEPSALDKLIKHAFGARILRVIDHKMLILQAALIYARGLLKGTNKIEKKIKSLYNAVLQSSLSTVYIYMGYRSVS
jgi:hypothetical protein